MWVGAETVACAVELAYSVETTVGFVVLPCTADSLR